MAVLVLGLVTTVTGIRQFGDCRVEFWRDRDAGCSVAAYYTATRDPQHTPNMLTSHLTHTHHLPN